MGKTVKNMAARVIIRTPKKKRWLRMPPGSGLWF